MYFDSQKPIDDQLEKCSTPSSLSSKERIQKEELPSNKVLSEIIKSLSKTLGLTLFGFDLIIDSATKQHAIIDINFFPDYKGWDQFYEIFFQFFVSKGK